MSSQSFSIFYMNKLICITISFITFFCNGVHSDHTKGIGERIRKDWEECCAKADTDSLYTCHKNEGCYFVVDTPVPWVTSSQSCRSKFGDISQMFINNVKLVNEEEEIFLRDFLKALNGKRKKGPPLTYCTSGTILVSSVSPEFESHSTSFQWSGDNSEPSDYSWLKEELRRIPLPLNSDAGNDNEHNITLALNMIFPATANGGFSWRELTELCQPLCEFKILNLPSPDQPSDRSSGATSELPVSGTTGTSDSTSTTSDKSRSTTSLGEIDEAIKECCKGAANSDGSVFCRHNSCYQLIKELKNWEDSKNFCKQRWLPNWSHLQDNLDLVSLRKKKLVEFLARKISSIDIAKESAKDGFRKIWTNGKFCSKKSGELWEDGEEVDDWVKEILEDDHSLEHVDGCHTLILQGKIQSSDFEWKISLEDQTKKHYFVCQLRKPDNLDVTTTYSTTDDTTTIVSTSTFSTTSLSSIDTTDSTSPSSTDSTTNSFSTTETGETTTSSMESTSSSIESTTSSTESTTSSIESTTSSIESTTSSMESTTSSMESTTNSSPMSSEEQTSLSSTVSPTSTTPIVPDILPTSTSESQEIKTSTNSFFPAMTTTYSMPSKTKMCRNRESHGIKWPDTAAGEEAIQSCPKGSTGVATWKCDPKTLQFTPESPRLHKCKSKWIDELKEKLQKENQDVVNITNSLAVMTSEKTLDYGGDIIGIVDLIGIMRGLFTDKIKEPDKKNVKTFVRSVCSTYSNIISSSQSNVWNGMPKEDQTNTSSNILLDIESVALMYSCSVDQSKKTETFITENIAFQTFHFQEDVLGQQLRFPYNTSIYNYTSTIQLPPGISLNAWTKYCSRDYTGVGIMYKDIGTYMSHERSINSDGNRDLSINSAVLAFNFDNSTSRKTLPKGQHVTITLNHNKKKAPTTTPLCVFWNFRNHTWDSDGCTTVHFNASHTTCRCDHLTNFAVLMDFQQVLPLTDEKYMEMLTFVSCALSSAFLILSMAILLSFRSLHSRRTTIVCNLSLCLLIVHLLVLFALDRTEIPIICSIFAGLLLYALLASFFWMLMEGYHIYQMLVLVLSQSGNLKRWMIYFCGYGLPFFIVVTAAATQPNGFGTERYCWLSQDKGLMWSLGGPAAAIILVNTIVMILALRNASTAKIKKMQTQRARAIGWIKGTFSLMCLLGLTWIFGFFFLNIKTTIYLSYPFIILNGLQGVFIFIFHVLLNDKARNQLLRMYKNKATSISTHTASIYQYPSSNPLRAQNSREVLQMSRSDTSSNTSGSSGRERIQFHPAKRHRK